MPVAVVARGLFGVSSGEADLEAVGKVSAFLPFVSFLSFPLPSYFPATIGLEASHQAAVHCPPNLCGHQGKTHLNRFETL